MSGFLARIFGRKSTGSSSAAKERLQFVLVHDRMNLPPEKLQEMKSEILAVISKYVAIDLDQVDIALEPRDELRSKIVAEIPFSKRGDFTLTVVEDEEFTDEDIEESLKEDDIDDETVVEEKKS